MIQISIDESDISEKLNQKVDLEEKIKQLKQDYLRQCLSRDVFYREYEQLGIKLNQIYAELKHSYSYYQKRNTLRNHLN
jgi:chromosome condensin MukBEF ATPase and DNA-binding subunit MukB